MIFPLTITATRYLQYTNIIGDLRKEEGQNGTFSTHNSSRNDTKFIEHHNRSKLIYRYILSDKPYRVRLVTGYRMYFSQQCEATFLVNKK